MGNYNVRFGDDAVTVNVIKHPSLVSEKLLELRNALAQRRVVGILADSNSFPNYKTKISIDSRWLVVCAGKRCLMIDLREVNPIPGCLESFLTDHTTCFVGTNMSNTIHNVKLKTGLECKSGVEVGHVAAQVLRKPNLESMGLKRLVSEVGLDATHFGTPISNTDINWSANVFTDEQMKLAIRDTYYSFLVGNKVLALL